MTPTTRLRLVLRHDGPMHSMHVLQQWHQETKRVMLDKYDDVSHRWHRMETTGKWIDVPIEEEDQG